MTQGQACTNPYPILLASSQTANNPLTLPMEVTNCLLSSPEFQSVIVLTC